MDLECLCLRDAFTTPVAVIPYQYDITSKNRHHTVHTRMRQLKDQTRPPQKRHMSGVHEHSVHTLLAYLAGDKISNT
jgi:hypothetical protein